MPDGLNGYRFKIKFDPLAGAAGSYRVNNVENILVRERVALTCNRVSSFNGYREHFISKHHGAPQDYFYYDTASFSLCRENKYIVARTAPGKEFSRPCKDFIMCNGIGIHSAQYSNFPRRLMASRINTHIVYKFTLYDESLTIPLKKLDIGTFKPRVKPRRASARQNKSQFYTCNCSLTRSLAWHYNNAAPNT